MRLCLKHRLVLRYAGVVLGLASIVSGVASAASLTRNVPPHVKSVVRADAHGRLIRTVIVSPRLVQPTVVTASQVVSEPESTVARESAGVPDLVEAAAKRYDVDPLLVHSVIQAESNYNPYAVSPKGAQGLMQLMPGTARRLGVRRPFEAADNIRGGTRYLRELMDMFNGQVNLVLASYNAGEGAVLKYGRNVPPYRETRDYVKKIGKRYGLSGRQPQDDGIAPSPRR